MSAAKARYGQQSIGQKKIIMQIRHIVTWEILTDKHVKCKSKNWLNFDFNDSCNDSKNIFILQNFFYYSIDLENFNKL